MARGSARQLDATILSFYAIVIPTMVVEIECLRYALELAAPSAGSTWGPRAR